LTVLPSWARLAHTHFELITADVRLEDGSEGTGCTDTGWRGGAAVQAMVRHALAPWLAGRDATGVEALHQALQWHVPGVGRLDARQSSSEASPPSHRPVR
jgi:L-alanine-DL-glutamate epimerase-like enolase superfamily enzyme